MCVDFGNMFGVFGDDYEVDNDEDDKNYNFDCEVIVDQEMIECFYYFFCCCCVGMFFY